MALTSVTNYSLTLARKFSDNLYFTCHLPWQPSALDKVQVDPCNASIKPPRIYKNKRKQCFINNVINVIS